MSKKEEFISYVEHLLYENDIEEADMPENVLSYWKGLKTAEVVEKPLFTDNGKMILKHMQEHLETEMWKAKDLAEGLFISSRSASGAMRKLVTDGFVEKIGENPSVYSITQKGKDIEIV
jgi:predicted transcriptional regulator